MYKKSTYYEFISQDLSDQNNQISLKNKVRDTNSLIGTYKDRFLRFSLFNSVNIEKLETHKEAFSAA